MSRIFKLVVGGCLLAEVTANFVSPGLGKCLDLEKPCKDGTHDDCKERETIEDMMKHEKTNVQLYECHGEDNQHFRIVNGQFQSFAMENFCFTADKIEDNANVHLEKCEDGNEKQQWDFTGDGYVKAKGSEKCLDVVAAKKDDGTREKFSEIKKHKVVNVHLYKCHDPKTTERVNQLWSWVPFKGDQPVTEKTERLWEMSSLGLARSAPATASGFAFFVAAAMFAVGTLVGKRMQRAPQPLVSLPGDLEE
jgi:hypothetical protein